MKALTVSEINNVLIEKGYKSGYSIDINALENKWCADCLSFLEYNGKSYCELLKSYENGACIRLVSYSKLNSNDKKEFQKIIDKL